MRKSALALVVLAAASLSGCAHMSLQEVESFIDRVNAGIATADELAHRFCPAAQRVGISAKMAACAAKANGTTMRNINAGMAWGAAFCANPTSTSVATLTTNAASGVRAVMTATDAGCSEQ